MKNTIRMFWVFVVIIMCFSLFSSLSIAAKITEPDIIGVFYLLNSTDGTLTQLERQMAVSRAAFRATAELKGDKSPVRIKNGQKQEFIIQLANGVDPSGYSLYQFIVKNGKRYVVLATGTLFGAKSEVSTLPFNVTRYGLKSYKFEPAENLPPGEYAFNPPGESNNSFCFGVD